MNDAHWHLVINHFPIIIPAIGLLLMVSGLILKSAILRRAAYCLFILAALTAIAAFSTGEGAEEVMEGMQGIDEDLIERHEEVADRFTFLLYLLGGLSLIGLWTNWKEKSYSKVFSYLAIALSLAVLFYARQTGTTGGEIRHTEIRTEASASPAGTIREYEHEKEEDD